MKKNQLHLGYFNHLEHVNFLVMLASTVGGGGRRKTSQAVDFFDTNNSILYPSVCVCTSSFLFFILLSLESWAF